MAGAPPLTSLRWRYLIMGALLGGLLPAAGAMAYDLLRGMGLALTINYWHFIVAPALAGAAGFGIGRLADAKEEHETAARDQAEQARAVLSNMGTCAYKTTLDGRWIWANEVAPKMFGCASREELMATPVPVLYAHPSDRGALLVEIARARSVYDRPVQLKRRDGTVFPARMTVHLQGGYLLGIITPEPPEERAELIPVCASCDRARDEEGTWMKLSQLLAKRQRGGGGLPRTLHFTHGICPPCAELLYGDLVKR